MLKWSAASTHSLPVRVGRSRGLASAACTDQSVGVVWLECLLSPNKSSSVEGFSLVEFVLAVKRACQIVCAN